MRRMLLAVTAGVLSLAGAWVDGRAFAEDAKSEPFAQRLFGNGPKIEGKSYACFVRRYDAAHLAKHPLQKVTAMKLLVTAENAPEDDEEARTKGNGLQYSFRLGLKFRDRRGDFDSSGSCGYPRASDLSPGKLQLFCGVDCDGGGVELEMANADKSMLLRVERVRIWLGRVREKAGLMQ